MWLLVHRSISRAASCETCLLMPIHPLWTSTYYLSSLKSRRKTSLCFRCLWHVLSDGSRWLIHRASRTAYTHRCSFDARLCNFWRMPLHDGMVKRRSTWYANVRYSAGLFSWWKVKRVNDTLSGLGFSRFCWIDIWPLNGFQVRIDWDLFRRCAHRFLPHRLNFLIPNRMLISAATTDYASWYVSGSIFAPLRKMTCVRFRGIRFLLRRSFVDRLAFVLSALGDFLFVDCFFDVFFDSCERVIIANVETCLLLCPWGLHVDVVSTSFNWRVNRRLGFSSSCFSACFIYDTFGHLLFRWHMLPWCLSRLYFLLFVLEHGHRHRLVQMTSIYI